MKVTCTGRGLIKKLDSLTSSHLRQVFAQRGLTLILFL